MVQVSSNLANPLIMIFTNVPKIKSIQPIIEKLHNISECSSMDLHKERVTSFNQYILAKNLSFSYDRQTQVLNEMNCIIEKGKKYVVVGKSGCGKSTFIKLLTGYYSDYKGTLLYDDRELTQLVKEDVVQLSSIIHQNIYLFNETIFDNICLHEDYPKEMIDKVVKESGLDKFISELPNGLFYQVGENGSNLSGGQKQRIAVARALIRNKPILILDEGTSAIDMQTAYDIESRLLKMNDLTLITITHNLEEKLLKKYDEIIYMENGNVKEQGCFQELADTSSCFSEYLHLKE